MCDGIVIDAHMVPAIRDALALGSGSLYDLICWVIENCGIARTPQIEAHWKTKCSDRDQFFWSWYSQQVLDRSIHDITPKNLGSSVNRKIRNDYGLSDPFVLGCIKCAHSTSEPRYILAEDIYFHDPKAKDFPTTVQIKIKESRNGCLCRYLEDQLGIQVGARADCKSHFSIDQGPCPNKNKIRIGQNQCPKLPNP